MTQVAIDMQEVISAAAKAALHHSYPGLTEETMASIIRAATQEPMYQGMMNAVRPEAAAVILVGNILQQAEKLAR